MSQKSIFPLVGFFAGYMVTATRKLTPTEAFKEKMMEKNVYLSKKMLGYPCTIKTK